VETLHQAALLIGGDDGARAVADHGQFLQPVCQCLYLFRILDVAAHQDDVADMAIFNHRPGVVAGRRAGDTGH
jgi:hypothetical protein